MGPDRDKVIHTDHDFRHGGHCHPGLEGSDGVQMWGCQSFVEVTPKTKVGFLQGFSNEKREIAAHPMAPAWPKKMQATMTFEATSPQTSRITITWFPWKAAQTAHDTATMARPGLTQGFDGPFAKRDGCLAELQSQDG